MSSTSLILPSPSSSLLLNPSSVFFSSVIFYSCFLCGASSYFLSLFWSSLCFHPFFSHFVVPFYDYYFGYFIRLVTYLHFIKPFPWFYLFLSFGMHSFVFPLFESLCFYDLGETATSPNLEWVALCRRWILLFNLSLVLGCLLDSLSNCFRPMKAKNVIPSSPKT